MPPADYSAARRALMRRDPVLAGIIRRHGRCELGAARDRFDHFAMLARAIVFQQLSTRAATTIHTRLLESLGGRMTPDALAAIDDDRFRAAGISRQKASYLRDLAGKVATGEVPLEAIESMADEEVVAALTAIKGIGRWTAEMFLIFRLQRLDVLPVGDLGIQNAIQKAYRLRKRPTPDRMRELAAAWQPYRSIACWYLWRSLDNEPASAPAARRAGRSRAVTRPKEKSLK